MGQYSFQEVMQQAQRMCDYRRKHGLRCNDCDAAHICGLEIRHVGLDTLCADADAVMSWAAEHPVVYPTWGEWLVSVGAARKIPSSIPFELTNGKIVDPPWDTVVAIHDPIPADIAQKLGIEPKER